MSSNRKSVRTKIAKLFKLASFGYLYQPEHQSFTEYDYFDFHQTSPLGTHVLSIQWEYILNQKLRLRLTPFFYTSLSSVNKYIDLVASNKATAFEKIEHRPYPTSSTLPNVNTDIPPVWSDNLLNIDGSLNEAAIDRSMTQINKMYLNICGPFFDSWASYTHVNSIISPIKELSEVTKYFMGSDPIIKKAVIMFLAEDPETFAFLNYRIEVLERLALQNASYYDYLKMLNHLKATFQAGGV